MAPNQMQRFMSCIGVPADVSNPKVMSLSLLLSIINAAFSNNLSRHLFIKVKCMNDGVVCYISRPLDSNM
jgi:hypothetical protein